MMADVHAQMKASGSIHFLKSLAKTALPNDKQTPKLTLPRQFVQKNKEKFDTLIKLRAQTSTGEPSKTSWPGQLYIDASMKVQIINGWRAFATNNGLRRGDYLIFMLNEDARSEFVVHVFRGPRGAPYFPDQEERQRSDDGDKDEDEDDESDADSDSDTEENTSTQHPRSHQNAAPAQPAGDLSEPPSFSKRMFASNIGRSSGRYNDAQFEFPAHFIRSHGHRVYDTVKLQGIHENSLNYVIRCHRRPNNLVKVYLTPSEWSTFVHHNGLKEGDELQFSLMADSYFLVRKIAG